MTPGVMRSVVGWFLRVAVPQMVFAICVSFTLAVSVPVSTHAYDTAAPMYDGASHSAQAHTGEAMLLTAGRVPEGAQRAVATATGPLSVVLLKSVAANSEVAATRSFGSGAGPHTAQVTVTRGGTSTTTTFTSGGMTAEEAALGFPRSSLATHTEARAMAQLGISEGDSVLIQGTLPPCPACKGVMNSVANSTGASITYEWPGGMWTASAG